MSTPEAAWPEELIEALAEYQYVRGAPFGAKWERAQFKDAWRQRATDDLNFCVAWRDPKGEPAVLRARVHDPECATHNALIPFDCTCTLADQGVRWWMQRVQSAEAERDALRAALRDSRREHLYVEDCWYSCPKSIDGCCDEAQGDDCNCGADAWNSRIDALLVGVDHGE